MKNLKKLFFFTFYIKCEIILFTSSYFQQKVDSYINVSLDDKNHFLNGDELRLFTPTTPTLILIPLFSMFGLMLTKI